MIKKTLKCKGYRDKRLLDSYTMKNILFLMMDQCRFDAFGFMGKFPVETPHIDSLARSGTVFDNAYCANPLCVPSRASIMTGLYSYDHGIYYNDQNWSDSLPTYAGELGANGYYTAMLGEGDFRPPRKTGGYQKAILSGDYSAYIKALGYGRKPLQGKVSEKDYLNRAYPNEPTNIPLEHYSSVFWADRAEHELDLIAQRRECGPGGFEPFLLKLSFPKPHSPCDQPEPYFSKVKAEDMPPPVRSEREIPLFGKHLRKEYETWRQLDNERALKHRAQYFGSLHLVDEMIGRVLQKLRDLGLYENTLIVLTGDHGDMLCDHYLQQKGIFFEPAVRVPMIFSGPGIPAGRRVRENVSTIDLRPTLLDYCGLYMPRRRDPSGRLIYTDQEESDGISLIPYFSETQEAVAPERIIVAENAVCGQKIMLKQGDCKVNYYVNKDGPDEIECYDLHKNPDEMNYLCDPCTVDSLAPEMRAALERVLEKSRRHAHRFYYFQNKVRPLFT